LLDHHGLLVDFGWCDYVGVSYSLITHLVSFQVGR
jgi:hypothetical protein